MEGKEGDSKEDRQAAAAVSWPQIDFQRDVRLGSKIGGGGVGLIYEATFKGQACALKTLFDPKVGHNNTAFAFKMFSTVNVPVNIDPTTSKSCS